MKPLKFILPIFCILFIFNYSYAQISRQPKVDSNIEAVKLFERAKKYFSHGEIDLSLLNLQLARKSFNSSKDMCSALSIDTWIAKINVFQGEYQLAISLLENTKSLLKSYDCLIETSDFKDLDELLDGLYYHSKGMDLVSQSKTHDVLISLEKARNIYQELGEEELQGLVIYQEGQAYRDSEEYEKALLRFKRVLQLSDSLDHLGGKMAALGNIGYCYARRGEHEKAKDFLDDSLTYALKMNNGLFNSFLFDSFADLVSKIARIHESRGEYKKTLQYYDYSLKFYSFSDNAKLKKLILYQMGIIYQKLYQFEKSLDCYNQCLKITRSLKDMTIEEVDLLIMIAFSYQQMSQYERSNEYFNQALRLNRKTNNWDLAKNALFGLGINSLFNGNTNEAIDHFSNLLVLCEQLNDRVFQWMTLSWLSDCYRSMKNLDKAIEYEKQALNILNFSDLKKIGISSERLCNLYWEFGKTDLALRFWLDAFKSYLMLEDFEEIKNFYNRAALRLYPEKYQTASKYLKSEILSVKKKEESSEKEMFINLLLANLYYYAGKPREAITYYKKGYALNKRVRNRNMQKAIIYGMAESYLEEDNATLALNYLEEILQFAKETKDVGLRLDVIEKIATFHFILGQPQKAIDMLNLGLKIARELGEERKQGDFYNWLVRINLNLGNFHKSIDYAMKGIDIYHEFGEFEKELLALNGIAGAYMRLNQFEKSVTYSNEALDGYIRAKNFDGAINSLLDLAYINWEFGNNHIANYFLEKAYTMLPRVKYQDTIKRLSFTTGLVLEKMGSYEQALFHLFDTLRWAQLRGEMNIYAMIEIYGAIALTYFDMGDQEKAGIYGEKVQALTAKSGYLWAEAFFLNYYSLVPLETKNYSEALAILNKARQIFKQLGNIRGEIDNLLFTSHVLSEQLSQTKKDVSEGDYKNIFNYLSEALNLSKNIGDEGNEAAVLTMLGSNYINAGKYANAEKSLKNAKIIAEQNKISELVITTNHYLGKVSEGKKQYMDALNYYEEAIKTIESLRSGFSLSVLKGKFLEKRRDVYNSYFSLLLRLHKLQPTKDFKSRAFTICEKAKARCLLDSLSRMRNPDLINKKEILLSKDTLIKIEILKEKLKTGMYSTEQETYAKINLEILRDALTLSKKSVQELAQPQISATESLIPDIQYTQIQPLLDENTLFVEYVFSEEKLYEWVITNDKFEIYELPINAQSLEGLVRNYGTTLRKPRLSTIELSNHIKLGQELFKVLLSPIKDEILAGKKLILVPDGPLYYLPFETLIITKAFKPETGQVDTQVIPYLITKTSIAYFHSGAVMASLMKKLKIGSKIENKQYEILAFGDPVYSLGEGGTEPKVDRRGFYENRGLNLERLTYSSQEVESIAKIFNLNPASESINLREKATEKRVHEIDIKKYKRIHFATHGILADEITWIDQPALVLSLVGSDKKYDGFLTMREIYDLDLHSDLVVLSACKTGLGEEIKGEGLVGLTHAFIHAGADSLVVSLWDVNDQSTSLLMEKFYQYLKTMNKSEALRRAKLDLMDGKFSLSVNRGVGGITKGADVKQSYSDPFYWAPFILIGKYE